MRATPWKSGASAPRGASCHCHLSSARPRPRREAEHSVFVSRSLTPRSKADPGQRARAYVRRSNLRKKMIKAPQSGCPLHSLGRSRTVSLNPQRVGCSRHISCDLAITSTKSTIRPLAHLVHYQQCCYAAGGDQTWHISTVSIP